MTHDIFIQGLGILATLFVVLSFTQKDDIRFKILIMIGAGIFTIHFLLLGAYAGAIVALLNTTRTGLSMTRFKGNYILSIFMMLYVVMAFIVYETWIDILPFFAGAGATFAMFKFSGLKLRYAFFCTEMSWFAYSIIVQSIGGVITNSVVLSMNTVTTYRLLKDKRHEPNT